MIAPLWSIKRELETSQCLVTLTEDYMQRQRRFKRAGPPSTAALSLLGKELREAHLQSLIGNSSRISSLITNAPDPLLSTSVYTVPIMETIESTSKPSPSVEEAPSNPPPLSQQPKPMWVSHNPNSLCTIYVAIEGDVFQTAVGFEALANVGGTFYPTNLFF